MGDKLTFFNSDEFVHFGDCTCSSKLLNKPLFAVSKGITDVFVVSASLFRRDDGRLFCINQEDIDLLYKAIKDHSIVNGIASNGFSYCAIKRCPYGTTCTAKNEQFCVYDFFKAIEKYSPKVLILLGEETTRLLVGDRGGKGITNSMDSYFGQCIPDVDHNVWLCPVPDNKYLSKFKYKEKLPNELLILQKEYIQNAISQKDKPIEKKDYKRYCHRLDSDKAVLYMLDILNNQRMVAFDYETTGLRLNKEGHKIVTVSFCWESTNAVSFYLDYDDIRLMQVFRQVLASEQVKKIAHNANFEHACSIYQGFEVNGWYWDTLLAIHYFNSHSVKGLKFNVFCNFGVSDYSAEVDKLIKADDGEHSNALFGKNKTFIKGLRDLFTYNALDSLFTFMLYEKQREQYDLLIQKNQHLKEGLGLLFEGTITLAELSCNGMALDLVHLEKSKKELQGIIQGIENSIAQFPVVKEWEEHNYSEFNPRSNKQIKTMLEKTSNKKLPSVSVEVLNSLKNPLADKILELRKYEKLLGTYIGQLDTERVCSFIHPQFSISIPVTYRSSSFSPNFQNMPSHDEEAGKYIMKCFIPRENNKFVKYDYKGVEVVVGACYHKDRQMVEYISNPSADMHRDTASDIFDCKPNEVTKEMRFLAKNRFVFASFYGSGVTNVATRLWEAIIEDRQSSLFSYMTIEKGFSTYGKFLEHMKKVYENFWEVRFAQYSKWKRAMYKRFQELGYSDYYTGFRYRAPAGFTKVTNACIQGSAFHVLLWTLIRVQKEVKKRCSKSLIIGQIHDAIVADVHPSEEDLVDSIIKKWGIEEVRKHWQWIILPLQLEKEVGTVDGDWTTMESAGYI